MSPTTARPRPTWPPGGELLREDGWRRIGRGRLGLPPHGHRVVSVEAMLGRFADVSYAYRFGPPQHAAVRAELTGPGTRQAVWRVPLASLR